jgi:hypothetical protein
MSSHWANARNESVLAVDLGFLVLTLVEEWKSGQPREGRHNVGWAPVLR